MSSLPQPDEKVQPIRLIAQREAHEAEARAGGVEDLVEFRAFYCGDILLFGAVAGPEDGPPVILLHGFPDFWLGWAPLIRPLVEAGYRVVIPDQRGYNFSEKPADVEEYTLEHLGADIIGLLDANRFDKAHLVGHDWGGANAWWLAEHHPERFRSVTILNCPHYGVMAKALKFKHLRQMMRSWYIALFQVPRVPEKIASADNYRMLVAALRKLSDTQAFSDREIEVYRKAWAQEGAVRSMLNWYRAARGFFLDGADDFVSPEIDVPINVIWGKNDAALDASLVEPSIERCSNAEIHWFDEAGHWVHRDCPEPVSELLLSIFQD